MPGFLDSMQQKADQVKFEIDRRNRIGVVQRQIDELKRQINSTFSQLGIQAMELHRQNQLPIPTLSPLCQTVLEHEAQIVACQTQIDAIRAEVMPAPAAYSPAPLSASGSTCLNCGQLLAPGARFCPNCGQPVMVAPPSTAAYEPGPPCPSCGVPTVKDAAFCNECGFSLSGPVSAPSVAADPPMATVDSVPLAAVELSVPLVVPVAHSEASTVTDSNVTVATAPASPIELPPPAEADLPFCPNCGARQRRVDARFCPVCGQAITPPAASALAVQEPADEPVS